MTDEELARRLYRFAKIGLVNYQDGLLLRTAADRLRILAQQVEDLEERVGIMMDGCGISEEKYQQMKIETTRE